MLPALLACAAVARDRDAVLIASERHTARDLALWREHEEADAIHFAHLTRTGKIERSIDAAKQWAKQGPCYASFSGGKDSLVLLGLLSEASLLASIPVVWLQANPKVNPDAILAVDAAAERFGIAIERRQYHSPWPGNITREKTEAVSSRNFLQACAVVDADYGRRILGLRADESGVRKIRFRRWGLSSLNSCAPLGWWTIQDVYAYAAHHALPLCSVYAMFGGGRWERHTLRVDALCGANGDQFGRAEWEAEYYSDYLRRAANIPS